MPFTYLTVGDSSPPPRYRGVMSGTAMLLLVTAMLATTDQAAAQLDVLSRESPENQWREAQISVLREQLANDTMSDELKQELRSQLDWLSGWKPGDLTAEASEGELPKSEQLSEPTIDPNGKASDLRARLFGPNARPTVADTKELQRLLKEHPEDLGVRQLHLHWLDQLQYRKEYCDSIAATARRFLVMLEDSGLDSEEQIHAARTFALYRLCRALAYRELPDVVAERPLDDPTAHDAALVGAYRQLQAEAGRERPEFILMDVRMLRRDRAFGRALLLLEQYGSAIDRKWYLKKRRDLLRELGWAPPAEEAATIYAKEFPEAAAQEAKDS